MMVTNSAVAHNTSWPTGSASGTSASSLEASASSCLSFERAIALAF